MKKITVECGVFIFVACVCMLDKLYITADPSIQSAGGAGVFIALALVSFAAMFLLQPDMPESPLDDSKSQPSKRGILTTTLLGRMRVGPVIGFVGQRRITKEKAPGGGGKGGGGSAPKTTIYNEVGMHIISIGKGRKIKGIYQGGKQILEDEISSTTTASGDTVDLENEGSFRVYWGEDSQPVDTGLAGYTGVSSSYPHIFYIVWDDKRLGQNAVWPQIEYDVEVTHPSYLSMPTDGEYISGFSGSFNFTATIEDSKLIDLTGFDSLFNQVETTEFVITTTDSSVADIIVGGRITQSTDYKGEVVNIFTDGTDYVIYLTEEVEGSYGSSLPFTSKGVEYSGVNPASALYQFLFAGEPHGLPFSTDMFNMTDFNTLADLFKNTEVSPCTILLRSGKSYKEAIANIMQDFGILLWLDNTTGLYRLSAVREGAVEQSITEDQYINNELAQSFGYAVLDANKIVYSFKDAARKFADSSIVIVNDAGAKYSDNPNTKKESLATITDFVTASMVASRREQEASVDEAITLSLSYEYADLPIGAICTLEGFAETYRLLSKENDPDSATLKATFAIDAYSITNNYTTIQGIGANPYARLAPVPDPYVGLVETNRFLSKDQNGFYVLRIRAGQYIINTEIRTSRENNTYAYLDTAFYSTGGILTAELPQTATLVEDGVFISIKGGDISDVNSLASSEELWRGGAQLAVIGTEICFLQGIDVGTGELLGLIRARYGTKMQTHPVNTPVFILDPDTLDIYSRSYLVPEAELYVKSLPFSSTAQVSASDVTAESITYKGGGFRPLPCENLSTPDGTNAFVTGADIDLRWSYKNASDTGAAGIGLAGEATEEVPPEGTFRLEVLDGSTVVRTINQAGTTYTYTNANLASDFGSEPASFDLRVYEVLNGLTSEAETATITRI